jgi:hypothetical protein
MGIITKPSNKYGQDDFVISYHSSNIIVAINNISITNNEGAHNIAIINNGPMIKLDRIRRSIFDILSGTKVSFSF